MALCLATAVLLLSAIVGLSSCAKVASNLTGGPSDTIPPSLILDESTQNLLTQWKGEPISLTFDEWVVLKNKSQILVSPPLAYPPDVKLKGKTVTFALNENEVLREATTYLVNFGEAIVDYTAGLPTENLQYIFSTGDAIDSLTLRGQVIDVLTGLGVDKCNVQLYDTFGDSTLLLDLPYYVTKTDKDGNFKLEYLKADTFQLFALLDVNQNYKYNLGAESVGFVDEPISIQNDTLNTKYTIKLFPETRVKLNGTTQVNARHLRVGLSAKPELYTIQSNSPSIRFQTAVKDSIFVWFDTDLDSNSVVTYADANTIDTLKWRKSLERIDTFMYQSALSVEPGQVFPGREITYLFTNPIDSLNTDSIQLIDTSNVVIELDANIKDRSLNLSAKMVAGEQYTLTLLPRAVIDMYGQANDTIVSVFTAKGIDRFSTLHIAFESLDSLSEYVFQFYDSKNILLDTLNLKSGDMRTLDGLTPGKYSAKVLQDDNGNGIWDTGNLLLRKQAEKIYTIEVETLRENWEVDLTIDWDAINN